MDSFIPGILRRWMVSWIERQSPSDISTAVVRLPYKSKNIFELFEQYEHFGQIGDIDGFVVI